MVLMFGGLVLGTGIIADSEGIQSHRDHRVIAAESGDLDGGFVAEQTEQSLERRVIGCVRAMELIAVVVNRFFRSFGECRTTVTLQRLDDVSRKAGFACQWLMDCPFHLRLLPAWVMRITNSLNRGERLVW